MPMFFVIFVKLVNVGFDPLVCFHGNPLAPSIALKQFSLCQKVPFEFNEKITFKRHILLMTKAYVYFFSPQSHLLELLVLGITVKVFEM